MKGCEEYNIAIQLYVDNELSGEDLEEFNTHLQICPNCRQEVNAELELSSLLRQSKPLHIAPDTLWERIIKAAGGHLHSHIDLSE